MTVEAPPDSLRLERAGQVCPELARAYRSGRLSWVRAQVLVPLVVRDEAYLWRKCRVDWATRVTVRRREDDVERALLFRETDPDGWLATGCLPEEGAGAAPSGAPRRKRQIRANSTNPERTARLFILAPRAVTALARAEHRVFERNGRRCVVPACTSGRNLHRHHLEFRPAGGSDQPDNCVTLCAFHHLRGVHAGRVAVRGKAPDALRFALGLRRGQAPLARYASRDLRIEAPPCG